MRLVEGMCYGARTTKVRRECGVSAEFAVTVGLHNWTPFLFVVVLDVLNESVRKEQLWALLYADDLGILAQTEYELRRRVVECQEDLERKILGVNKKKTYVNVCTQDVKE